MVHEQRTYNRRLVAVTEVTGFNVVFLQYCPTDGVSFFFFVVVVIYIFGYNPNTMTLIITNKSKVVYDELSPAVVRIRWRSELAVRC